jgi:hypothetical protein
MYLQKITYEDWDECPEDLVGFVQGIEMNRGNGTREAKEIRYFSAVFREPVTKRSKPVIACGHSHWKLDEALECVRRLIKLEAGEST